MRVTLAGLAATALWRRTQPASRAAAGLCQSQRGTALAGRSASATRLARLASMCGVVVGLQDRANGVVSAARGVLVMMPGRMASPKMRVEQCACSLPPLMGCRALPPHQIQG